ncbi:hypothetical protein MDAP_000223 [Mitosporidium daphniae]|uniref:Uncharacterized protein n=1 Tax=Mitosporidium daphniae TaxID=1485682 RepID=A0A098VS09_9MICR|nr:uncharacterized protein DI09_26p280 [Mitosporidium daphniae]KGG51828.1 hypothetical protein DI09_26p280 [Mitosporidium daphniae]|eukprot:XP_013238255.1 uncharacterized protein DI09_26p280 [Mitosporidium daphniae]
MSDSKRCLTSHNCPITDHCDMQSKKCVRNSKPGSPCKRFVRAHTCGDGMRCNSISSRCVSDKEPMWLLSMLGFASYNGYGSSGCGRGDLKASSEALLNGCHSMSCHSSLDCAANEFCGIFVDENGKELPFNPSPQSDGEYLSVVAVGNEATERRYSMVNGFCIPRRSLNQYCTSSAMCAEGLGCDLESSLKCRIHCYSQQDCSSSSLLEAFPGIFNASNRQFLTNGQCLPLDGSFENPGFCAGFIKSSDLMHSNSNLSATSPLSDNIHGKYFLNLHPYYILFGSLFILAIVVLSSIWCCGNNREASRIEKIRRQQKRFVRLARSGAAPSSNLFTSPFRDDQYQPPSASYPWNNPSRN